MVLILYKNTNIFDKYLLILHKLILYFNQVML